MSRGTADGGRERSSRQRNRRSFLRFAGAGGVTALLAGCAERTQQGPFPGPSPTVTAPPQPLAGEDIHVGALAPEPDSFPAGQSMWNAMRLAAADLNENGVPGIGGRGILGAKVEPVLGNTQASPGTAREEFDRLVRHENCSATFGTFRTQCTLQLFDAMAESGTIHLTTGAPGPKPARLVSDRYERYRYHFRVGPLNTRALARATLEFLATHADRLGWDTVAVVVQNVAPLDPFAAVLEQGIRDVVDAVPVFKRSASGTTNWSPLWDEVESADADVALLAQRRGGGTAVEQWANQQRDFELGGLILSAQDYEFWDATGGDCRYVFTMNAATQGTTNTPETREFMRQYRERFDTYPVYTGPITYDAVRLYATAMARYVFENNLTRVPTSDEMVEALEHIEFTHGTVLPEYRFTPPGADYAHEPRWESMTESGVPVWQQWQIDRTVTRDYGVMHSVAPEQNKTADYAYPEWIDYPSDHPANQ